MTAPVSAEVLPFECRLGAWPSTNGRTHFRVWAPNAAAVAVRLPGGDLPMAGSGYGIWELEAEAAHGDDYRFVVDGAAWPDPCSHWQPEGLRGPSRVVDPDRFQRMAPRPELDLGAQVLYELHVGTFSEEGTFAAAVEHLAPLAALGVTAIELMPVNEFPGHHGWGYDGVYPGAAQSSYGGPVELARLVEAAHELGLGVVLDVVYNHVGPTGGDGLAAFGPYFTDRYHTPWGDGPNLDGLECGGVREWMLQSAEWWVGEVGLDGLRVDALHAIGDNSARHFCAELTERVRAVHPGALLVAESGLNDPRTVTPTGENGWGFDADWADDFHHALRTLLTGERDGWYADYGEPDQLARVFRDPYLFTGQYVPFRRRRFGADAADRPIRQFVVFDQNHDQVGNRAMGDRLPAEARPLAAMCLLFSPATPMLFMGEEYGEDAPFQYFCDHIDPFIADATRNGRRREFARFSEFGEQGVPDPQDPETFRRSKLTRRVDPALAELYRSMLALHPQLPLGRPDGTEVEGRVVRVTRGRFELVANFGDPPVTVTTDPKGRVIVAGPVEPGDAGQLIVPSRCGVVLERPDAGGSH